MSNSSQDSLSAEIILLADGFKAIEIESHYFMNSLSSGNGVIADLAQLRLFIYSIF